MLLENFKYLFFTLTKYATDAYARALEHEQEIIMNLADILAEIYVLESTYLRVEKLKSKPTQRLALINFILIFIFFFNFNG